MIRVLDSAGSTLVEWGRQQQQHVLGGSVDAKFAYCLREITLLFYVFSHSVLFTLVVNNQKIN